MIFDDDETLHMYVEESLEHLADIENDLLSIEESGADIDEELVNNVFRAAHSIKGGAGFMGLTVVKDLSHNLENVLGMVRTGDMVPTPGIISVLLRAFDKLRELIEDIKNSNEMDVADHVQALVDVTTDSLPSDDKESVTKPLTVSLGDGSTVFEISQFDIDRARQKGMFIYLIEYDLINDLHHKGKHPLEVFSTLQSSGIVLESKIDFAAVGTLETATLSAIPFFVLFASILEPDMADRLFELEAPRVHVVGDDMVAIPLVSHAPPAPEPVADTAPQPFGETAPQPPEPVQAKAPEPAAPVREATPPPPRAKTEPSPATDTPNAAPNAASKTQSSLRVNVNLLDTLMTLAGELVLSRNQLLQGLTANNGRALEAASQRIDMITSELQEAIMRTRMQPISNVFNKYSRVVRDLAQDLGKSIDLDIRGKEVELDKTIIESINDPLTHLVRNAVDHGIETPEIRQRAGKAPTGEIKLRAFHEAGQVNIEISDDGKGLDGEALAISAFEKGLLSEQQISSMSTKEKIAIIFLPGFSTAKEVTDVSGRGVGMDVVKTNLDKLGGIIDIDSTVGKGTVIKIKLPLTLAIIPSQIISVGSERYAIPQVNLDELLRIPAAQVKERIEKVGDADVVRLRGTLLPLLNLSEVLNIPRYYTDPDDLTLQPDRRKSIADRRSRHSDPSGYEITPARGDGAEDAREASTDRRYRADSAINIAVVSAGQFKYGLVVDQLRDSEEIVVKPLGRHLKECDGYAGATIMGDGKVALILDVASLARMAELSSLEGAARVGDAARSAAEADRSAKDRTSLLLFRNMEEEQFAAPLNLVERIERVLSSDIELVGGKKVIQYRGGTLPLFELSEVVNVPPLPERKQREVIVFKLAGREVGLMVTPPVDAMEINLSVDATTLKQKGIMGSVIIGDYTTLMVDIFEIVKDLNPDWFKEVVDHRTEVIDKSEKLILFAEDSAFFRNQVRGFLEEDGYNVLSAEDGEIAWELLQARQEDIDLVLTDLEMPNMDGFELTRKIKADARFADLSVVALTSLAGEEDMAKGRAVGIDDYQIKLDREKLLERVRRYLKK